MIGKILLALGAKRTMDVLITDVTEMGGGNYCVAGWNADLKQMVRPLPDGGNWPAALLSKHGIVPGVTISVTKKGAATGIFPHRTEDTPIDSATINVRTGLFTDWLGLCAPRISVTLDDGFGGNLAWNGTWNGVRQGVHTTPKTLCGSLVAISVPIGNLSFCEPFNALKAIVSDGVATYQLTVSNRVLKEAWREGGLPAVTAALPNRDRFHVRVGLARPFGDPLKCYAMLNGVL